jgi:hypothetical protein
MAINITDTKHLEKFKLAATAHWAWVDVLPPADPHAVDFAPPGVDSRPVLYIPVKRRGGLDTFPQLQIQIQVLEKAARRLNFQVPSLVGAEVKIELGNLFLAFAGNAFHLTLPSGRLNDRLGCTITIDAGGVKNLLDPQGPMKARLNENLLFFLAEIPAIQVDGQPLQGTSENRVYLYRKKSIVFLPGVFGSQFQVEQGNGKKDAFPNFLDDESLARFIPAPALNILLSLNIKQRIGVLECDSHGHPILPAFKPKLLRFGGFVYDSFTKLREARDRKLRPVPTDFLVYDLRLFAYDWRGDLTEASSAMMDRLCLLQKELRAKPDTDDQIAVAGHSTGGVIIRRMLGQAGASGLISHAFFLNVPFRGAPKALSVFLTGCDPPGGSPMIPFIDAYSLRNIASCAPIVYHLAPSFAFPTPVAEIPGGIRPGPGLDREREKSAFVDAAPQSGIYFFRRAVDHSPDSIEERAQVAAGADAWSSFLDEAGTHQSGRALYQKVADDAKANNTSSPWASKFVEFVPREIASRKLEFQNVRRGIMGWNVELAGKAQAFHEASEAVAAKGAWADKAFIFYSKGHPTTGRVIIEQHETVNCGGNMVALMAPSNTTSDLYDGVAHPPAPTKIGWNFGRRAVAKQCWRFGEAVLVALPGYRGRRWHSSFA